MYFKFKIGFESALNIDKNIKIKREIYNDEYEKKRIEKESTDETSPKNYNKKKKFTNLNKPKEEILEIPNNALSYLEYKQIQKEKNILFDKKLNIVNDKSVPKISKENEMKSDKLDEKKKFVKLRDSILVNNEKDISYVISSTIRDRKYPKEICSENENEKKFHFDPEDFPELK